MNSIARIVLGLAGLGLLTANALAAKPESAPPRAFHVTVSGQGRPMLLIPGLGCSGAVWDATVAALKDRYSLHVLTLAGFGGEPAVAGPLLPRVRDDIVRYVREQKLDHPVVVGHSLGGFLGYALATAEPALFGPVIAVDGVPFLPALMDPTATAQGMQAPAAQMRDAMAASTHDAFVANTRAYMQGAVSDPAELERVLKTSALTDPRAEGTAIYELMTTDLRPQLGKITQPVLLIGAGGAIPAAAMRDAFVAAYEAQIAAIPQHEFVLAPKARHFVMLDDPAFFLGTLEAFLARVSK